MKKFVVTLVSAAALALVGNAGAAPVIPIPMHDPGCHWFYVGGKYVKSLTTKGPVSFVNEDENTLIFQGPGGIHLLKVGQKLTLTVKGVYHITMLHQMPDDNHLTLVLK